MANFRHDVFVGFFAMYLISQVLIYLALALIIGGGIGFLLRSCLADTACDPIRDELALVQARYDGLLQKEAALETRLVEAPVVPIQALLIPSTFDTPPTSLAGLSTPELEALLPDYAPGTPLKDRFGSDDLTQIRGINQKTEVWLGLQGITRYSHIADLTPGELYWLVENLPTSGASVYRDQWVAQATRLSKVAKP